MSQEIQTYNPTSDSVVIYRSADNAVQLDVQISEETVWLTQRQMAALFNTTPQNITVHIRNIYKEGELLKAATCKDFLQVQIEGGREIRRVAQFYNLDVIISVGYRVKSQRGVQFRQWATKVLNNYLRHGYAINNRFERLEQRMAKAEEQIESFVHSALPPREGIFVDGQIYDAFDLAEKNFNVQYGGLAMHTTQIFHDRFLIIDDKTIYLIGASLKDAGKRLFAFTQMDATQIETIKSKL